MTKTFCDLCGEEITPGTRWDDGEFRPDVPATFSKEGQCRFAIKVIRPADMHQRCVELLVRGRWVRLSRNPK